MPLRPIAGNGEEGLDGMVHLEGRANLEDDRHRALSEVRDVLDEHQSKNGGSRAPNPDTLAKYARKLKTRSGPSDVDEVNVSLASAFSCQIPHLLHCYHTFAQDNTSTPESVTGSRRSQPTTHSETRKRGNLIYSSAVKQII